MNARLQEHLPSRLVALVVVLTLVSVTYASAAHLAASSKKLGSGATTVGRCMTGSQMTVTYYLNSSGKVATVVVGNIASSCVAAGDTGMLQLTLAGSGGTNLEGFGPLAISSCSLSTTYACTLSANGTVSPTSVLNAYGVITGP